MKVGILTFHRALNYGAVWQCWALVQACLKLGHDARVIDYAPVGFWRYSYFRHKRIDRRISLSRMLYHFNKFYKQLPLTDYYGESHEAIVQNPPQLDAYIVGSDQMWSEALVGKHLGSFVFDFAQDGIRRISYAVSQGGVFAESPIFIPELKKFAAISLREPTYKDKLAKLVGKDVEDVCDPSLLISGDEYAAQEQKVWLLPKHYIAVFDLNGEPFLKECAIQLSKTMGLPLVSLAGGYKRWCNRSLFGITPRQWIYTLRHADFVCTNSFHGTAFSINFRKPFVSIASQKGDRKVSDDRKTNLLQQCNLMTQYIQDKSQLNDAIHCNFSNAETYIEEYKIRSLEWLKNALQNETDQK